MDTIIEIINSTDRSFTIDELKQLRNIMLEKIREIRKKTAQSALYPEGKLPPKKRGRKIIYQSEEERKLAHQKQKNAWMKAHRNEINEKRRKTRPTNVGPRPKV